MNECERNPLPSGMGSANAIHYAGLTAKITDLGAVRAARARPINQACRWSEAVETVITANLRAACVLKRMWLRAWGVC